MKRLVKLLIITFMMLFLFVSNVNAATTDDLIAYLTQVFTIAGEEVKIPDWYVNSAKRYLAEYPVSEEDGDKILEIAKKGEKLLDDAGVYDPKELSQEKKQELLDLGQEVAKIAGASITYNKSDNAIEVYKDGKLYDSLPVEMHKFRQTGNNEMMIYVVMTTIVAIIAVASVIIYRKKKVNE